MRTEKRYIGYWNFNNDTPTIAGTLIVGNDISLELVEFNEKSYFTDLSIDSLKGIALDDNNETYFFDLLNLKFLYSHISNKGAQFYAFSVSYLFFSMNPSFLKRNDHKLSVSELYISSPYLNSWCCSKSEIHNYEFSEKGINYHYNQPSSSLLSELDDCEVSAFISRSTQLIPDKGFYNYLEPFIKIKFYESREIKDCFPIISKIENLLSLFMDCPFVNESIYFDLGKIKCNCIQNIKIKHFNFSSIPDENARFTSVIQDVLDNNVLKHWIDLYKDEPHALRLFFDTIYNEELSDELQIICYASVLEELTKRYYTSDDKIVKTKKNNTLLGIIELLRKEHHPDEANFIKTKFLDKGDYFEVRLLNLLQMHQDVWEQIEIEEFAKKTALTRNFLVHRQISENQKPYLFQPNEYYKVANTLRYIIAGTLLRELGFLWKDDIIRILCFIWPQPLKDEQFTWLKPPQYDDK